MNTRLAKNPDFRRLKLGGGRAVVEISGGHRSYWLGRDHLLVVEVSNYIERYRRFYFRDIQAIVIQHTNVRLYANIVFWLFGTAGLMGLLAVSVSSSSTGWSEEGAAGTAVLGILALLFLIPGLINVLTGPTCAVHIRTAVQTQKLNGIRRWRKAEQLLAELTPLVEAAQTRAPSGANLEPAAPPPAEAAPAESPSTSEPGPATT